MSLSLVGCFCLSSSPSTTSSLLHLFIILSRRSSRDPSNAWSKPLVFRQKEEEKSQISPRCLNFPAESTSASASSASTTASDEGASGDLASVRVPLATSSRRSSTPRGGDGGVGNRGGGDADSVSSIKSKRAGSPDSGLHHSPAPSHGNRSSEERHGSRSRNNSGEFSHSILGLPILQKICNGCSSLCLFF